jgi:hypothetical protein
MKINHTKRTLMTLTPTLDTHVKSITLEIFVSSYKTLMMSQVLSGTITTAISIYTHLKVLTPTLNFSQKATTQSERISPLVMLMNKQ